MHKIKLLIFDLDGTTAHTLPGITEAVNRTCRELGYPLHREESVLRFVNYGVRQFTEEMIPASLRDDDAAVAEAMALFLKNYGETYPLTEHFPGIPELLQDLRAAGAKVCLATSKPELFAEKILVHFGLRDCFDVVTGATMDERLVEKADVLREAMRRANADPRRSVMVGDRRHDVLGAAACGIPAIGVTYGYGSREELLAAGAAALAASPGEVLRGLLERSPHTPKNF